MAKFSPRRTPSPPHPTPPHPPANHLPIAALLVLLLTGCASISISEQYNRARPIALPQTIYVRKFAAPAGVFYVDRQGAELREVRHEIQTRLQRNLVRRLSQNVAPARAWDGPGLPSHPRAWLLEGEFNRAKQGSRLLRAGVGFGLGATRLETTARLYDLSASPPRLLLTLRTTGGSNAEPGAIGAINPLTFAFSPVFAALNAAGGARSGLTLDSVRTSREITAAINEFCYEYGLRPAGPRMAPKRLGELPRQFGPINFEETSPIRR